MGHTDSVVFFFVGSILFSAIAIFRSGTYRVIDAADNERNNAPPASRSDVNRPWMILHVGPPKTGTTTIQNGLERLALRLARDDNVFFIGCVLFHSTSVGGQHAGEPNVTMFRIKDFLHSRPTREFTEVLRDHQRKKHNVVVSSEILSSMLYQRPEYWQHVFRYFFLSSSLGDRENADFNEEPFFGFNVRVVVTYRHFFEWLPSYWAQWHTLLKTTGPPSSEQHRDTCRLYPYDGYIPGIVEYTEWFLRNITEYTDPSVNHTAYTKAFPNPTRNETEALPTSHGSIWSYLQWSSTPELRHRVDLFDFHQQERLTDGNMTTIRNTNTAPRNLLADFVYQMLPSAIHTCNYLTENTVDDDFRARSRKQEIVSTQDMHRIKQMAAQKGRKLKNEPVLLQKPSRVVIRWFQKHPPSGLQRCLDGSTLARLKSVSWNFLWQQLLVVERSSANQESSSALFRPATPTDHLLLSSRSLRSAQQQQHHITLLKVGHDKSFEEYIASGTFCEIDVVRLFQNESFVRFALV